jgi:hypothetical protein
MPRGDPDYWKKTHEPLNLELQVVVRRSWVDRPPVPYAQPTKPARMGAKLHEHVWNASLVGVDVAVASMPYLCYERE